MALITRPTKTGGLYVASPVMPAAGTLGLAGEAYRDLIDLGKLGALVTNPITYEAWSPASGTRVVPLDSGVLVHTGLPNPGVRQVLEQQRAAWRKLPVPLIAHLVGTTPEQVRKGMGYLGEEESVAAIELGLSDDLTWEDAEELVMAATEGAEKPIIVRLPVFEAYELAPVAVDAGADALVVAAAPRGTARDVRTGRLVSGRIYGPLIKPMLLRMVGVLKRRLPDIPIIGAGGIHTPEDARDYLEAGAVAVQVDSVTWIKPRMLERIARDLGGKLITREVGAYPDEWNPDMGDTEFAQLNPDDDEPDMPSAQQPR